jgi:DNA-binding IclR family transcriptional regulator
MSVTEPTSRREGVKSAQRALTVLELLARSEAPLTFGEIGAALDYPRSSLFGLLNTLLDRHWLEFDGQSRKYWLGIRTLEAGSAYLRSIDLVQLARPHMERVRDLLDETVQLAVLEGRFNIYIGKVEGTQHLRLASEVGLRLAAHATALGKMLLAGLSKEELERLMATVRLERFTPQTITDFATLHRELDRTRERGYATDDEEHTLGVRCVAVPIRDHAGRTVAALSVSFPTVRYTDRRRERARVLLLEAVAGISQGLGHQPETWDGKEGERPDRTTAR